MPVLIDAHVLLIDARRARCIHVLLIDTLEEQDVCSVAPRWIVLDASVHALEQGAAHELALLVVKENPMHAAPDNGHVVAALRRQPNVHNESRKAIFNRLGMCQSSYTSWVVRVGGEGVMRVW